MSVRSPVTVSRALCLLMASLVAPAGSAIAEPLAHPTGPVVLTITGAIAETNAPGKAEFDRAMLDALGADEVKTSTDWTEGMPAWQGVRFSTVLDAVGANGATVVATALNGYSGEIGMDVIGDFPVLLATSVNGEPLAADKKPIWIIYPIDDYPELLERDDLHWAWQLATVDVR